MKATILSGQSISSEIDIASFSYFALEMPAEWTAANITIQALGFDGKTWKDVYNDEGTEVTITAAANRVVSISTNIYNLIPLGKIRLRSGTAATPVNQLADRDIYIIAAR